MGVTGGKNGKVSSALDMVFTPLLERSLCDLVFFDEVATIPGSSCDDPSKQ